MRIRHFAARAACVTVASLAPATASADAPTKKQCLDADDASQPLRRDGKFAAAREQLRVCGDPACPALVRNDCTRMMADLERAQPTVVFDVRDEAGNDLTDVKVTVDGALLTDKLTGTALQADPGQHVFAFEVAGKPPASRTLVLHEGEKDRHERITLASPAAEAQPAQPVVPPSPVAGSSGAAAGESPPPATAATGGLGTQRWIGIGLGGVGLAGVAVGGIFGALAISAKNAQSKDCASVTSCQSHAQALSDHSSVSTDATISTVAFVGGGVLLAAGAVLFFTGASPTPAAPSGLVVFPAGGPGSAGITMRAAF